MNNHKIDDDLKKEFEKEQKEIPNLITQRIHFTLRTTRKK